MAINTEDKVAASQCSPQVTGFEQIYGQGILNNKIEENPMKEERSKAKIWNLSLKSWKEKAFNDVHPIFLHSLVVFKCVD